MAQIRGHVSQRVPTENVSTTGITPKRGLLRGPRAGGFFPRFRYLNAFSWLVLPALAWIGVAVLSVYVVFAMTGCRRAPIMLPLGVPNDPDSPLPHIARESFGIVGWLASISLALGVAIFVASFWVPLIPVRASGGCLLAAVGLWILKYLLETYLHLVANVGLILAGVAAAVVLIPLAITWVNAHLHLTAKNLAGVAPEAAKVLQEAADGGLSLVGRIKRQLNVASLTPASANVGPLPGGETS